MMAEMKNSIDKLEDKFEKISESRTKRKGVLKV